VPARGLCGVPADLEARCGVSLAQLAVLADAITTPYEAARRAHLHEGDVAIYIGVGGVGGFGVQVARALGAHVIAIDVDPDRLKLASEHGASLALDARELDPSGIRDRIRAHLKEHRRPMVEWKIFETSGTKVGQETAWRLLVHGAHLGVVGFTLDAATVRLSNLMALDARAEGNWGCPPDLYPEALDLVLHGKVEIGPYVVERPLKEVNRALEDLHAHREKRRIVLIPEAS
jgi:6-hydroxycyclohex-1-ene-1-carbonyl-CoA dehydrogenase